MNNTVTCSQITQYLLVFPKSIGDLLNSCGGGLILKTVLSDTLYMSKLIEPAILVFPIQPELMK